MYQREERMILLALQQEWSIKFYIRVLGILNGRSDVKIYDKIKVTY